MQIEFDYYTTAQTPIDCAKWLAFIRLYAYVRTPACIYSKILMPSSKQIWRNVHVIPVPDYISNILATFLKEISAREAALDLDKLPVSDQSMLKDLYIEHGVVRYNSTFKPRDLGPYGLSRYAVVRLGATCVGSCGCGYRLRARTDGEAVGRLCETVGKVRPGASCSVA